MQERILIPIPEARRLLGDIGRTKAYDLMSEGAIKSVKVGKRRLIIRTSVEDYVARLSQKQGEAG